ncbi:Vacuolar H ATPase [Trichostrongylus colubriformis]|uniref:Vacuolar H ATPase n=1 Tax=Trichostrongylus colubriformis TaxID=6319 RepID=A0AAN8EQZ7_TRICO
MRGAALVLLVVSVCSASVLEFVTLPKSLSVPSPSAVPELRLSNLPQLNENLLGLSAKSVQGFDAKSDLFSRPRAIAVVRVDGIDSLNSNKHATYKIINDKFDGSSLDGKLASVFGADRETVTVDHDGSRGSEIAKIAAKQEIKNEAIKTKLPTLREELEHVHRLAAAIISHGTKFEKSNAADVYRVTISGMAGKTLSPEERAIAIKDVQNAVYQLTQALTTVYGGQAIVEVVAISDAVKSSDHLEEHIVIRKKRASDMTDTDKNLKTWREQLNVYAFTSTDYPAIFAIFAGLAVLYTVVGMMSMDPSRDSIIYRMTTTRMKKA